MQNTETATENTHQDDCRSNETNSSGLDWGCTCNWNEQDDEWLRRTTD